VRQLWAIQVDAARGDIVGGLDVTLVFGFGSENFGREDYQGCGRDEHFGVHCKAPVPDASNGGMIRVPMFGSPLLVMARSSKVQPVRCAISSIQVSYPGQRGLRPEFHIVDGAGGLDSAIAAA
jgi:hypothetical protein